MTMIKVSTNSEENNKKNVATRYILSDGIALDGAELIPIECGGRLIGPTISVNELGKQLLKAAADGNVEETKSLLNVGALFTADWLGTSPLHFAARNNHVEICEILLRAGISKDARTKVDKTSLHMAAYEGHVNVVTTLLEYGADPDCRDLLGMTPLHWAAQNGHIEVIKVLLKFTSQTDPLNKFDLTPADLAAQINRLDIVELINMGASEPSIATQHLTLQLASENNDDSNFQNEQINQSPSVSNSPIPLETILLEGNESTIDPERLHLNTSGAESNESDNDKNIENNTFIESMKLLQEHGITMLPNDDNNILSTVMESGHSVVLTEVGKEMLNSLKESEQIQNEKLSPPPVTKKKIITVTPEEFLAMTTNGNKTNILKQINGRLVPKNIKRIVMKKNKVIPVSSSINNIYKSANSKSYATDMETVMTQLIEARKTIEEYKIKLLKKEEEAERYKQQLKFLMDES